MTGIQLEVVLEDQSPHKWRVPLKEDVFAAFMAKGGPMVHKVFGDKSLFGQLLFKNIFDPSAAFSLWEFEPGLLLSDIQNCVDRFQTEGRYILKFKLPMEMLVALKHWTVRSGVRVAGSRRTRLQACQDWQSKVQVLEGVRVGLSLVDLKMLQLSSDGYEVGKIPRQ
ncbi:21.7 kDa class VI heat shock protein [Tanacetum coccineum]